MRTDLGHVSIRNLGVEKWAGRLVLLALWVAGGTALAIDRGKELTSCVAPIVLLAGTALLLAYRQGRSLVGARRRGASGSMTAFDDVLEVERLGRVVRVSRADVIAGWTEGLQLMVVGEKRRLWIPEALAYKGRDPKGMLVFDVELIKIQ